ncbi:MAG: hypothetical protein J6O55_01630 [Lachnospiraceae bacterium]|nr:hypothetical protein [Lachnospiraceae bacterium]
MTVDNMNTVMSGRTGVNFTVRPMTLENPALIKAAQESSSLFNMPIEDLLLDALKVYKEARRMDDFFKRIEQAEEVSDEENAEIGAEIESMTDEDRRIVRVETVTI